MAVSPQIIYSRGQNKLYVSFVFRPVKRSSKKTVTSIIARAQKLQQNDPVEKNEKKDNYKYGYTERKATV